MPKSPSATELIVSRRVLLQAAAAGLSSLGSPALINRAAGQAVNWRNGNPLFAWGRFGCSVI
jgi:hypothetical protein